MADFQQNFLSSLAGGLQIGQQIKQQRDTSQINRLAGLAYGADPGQREQIQGQMAAINPQMAQQQEKANVYSDERRQKTMVNMAGHVMNMPPQARANYYNNQLLPVLRNMGITEAPAWSPETEPVIMKSVQDIYNASTGATGGPHANLPSDIRSLKLLQENPELATLDRERRQAGGMIPKLVQTAQGYGWGTPGSSIDLAPMGGVAGQGGVAPQRQDMEADIALANEMIASGIPEAQVDAFLSQRGQRVPAQAPSASSAGGIAQPYQAPQREQIPSGYRATPGGGLEAIPGGPADKPETPSKPMPASILRMQRDSREALSVAQGMGAEIGKIRQQLASNEIDLGPAKNLAYRGLNATGQSSKQSRNYQGMMSAFEKLRNDSLRLNNGVQTEGDAQRAWAELLGNLGDNVNVDQQLQRIEGINQRAIQLHTENMDEIEAEYGGRNAPGRAASAQPSASDFSNLWN